MAKIPEHLKTKIPGAVFERETLVKTKQPNPARKIEFEVGDVLQDDFLPQWKTKHWDNECNFSARLVSKDGSVTEHDGKLAYDDGEKIARFYEKDTGDEDGGFEFDVVLNQKPASNVLTWTLQHKDLDFFYQPPLTAEEIEEGATRPENVEGSYAVYHKTKKNNKVGGKEYRTGKAFHIYRPYAEDKKGDRVWCELNITDDVMTVTIPQEWLDSAVYPVVVDPTFGYTTIGSSSFGWTTNFVYTSTGTPTDSGTVDSVTVYCDFLHTARNFKGVIYDSSGTLLTNGVGAATTSGTSDAWRTSTFSTPPSVTGSSEYFAAFVQEGGSGVQAKYDTGSAGDGGYQSESYASPDGLTLVLTQDTWLFSVYATYTASARRRIFIIS